MAKLKLSHFFLQLILIILLNCTVTLSYMPWQRDGELKADKPDSGKFHYRRARRDLDRKSDDPGDNNDWPNVPVESRIVGGRPAKFGEVPYQVRVERDDGMLCGGVLLNHCDLKFVITAAHCVYKGRPTSLTAYPPNLYKVVGADLDQYSYQSREQWFNVKHIQMHQDYDPRYLLNDLALLFLERHVFESLGLEHVELPQSDWPDPQGFCRVSGWGTARWREHPSRMLQVLELPVMEWETCKQLKIVNWKGFLGPKEFCLGNERMTPTGTCSGDSGGPAVAYNSTTQRWHLYGITSYVINQLCGSPYLASVYTRIINYVDWIKGAAQGWLATHGTGNQFTNGTPIC